MDLREARRIVVKRLIQQKFEGSQADFSRATGIPPSYVTRMLKAREEKTSKAIGEQTAMKIESALNLPTGTVTYPVLAEADYPWPPPKSADWPTQVAEPAAMQRYRSSEEVPAEFTDLAAVAHGVSLAQARVLPTMKWEDLSVGELPDQFRVRVDEAALAPVVAAGAMVTFDRTVKQPRPGDGVLVRDRAGGVHFRRYRPGVGADWEAYAMNDAYRTLRSAEDGLELIAVFVGAEHRLG